MRQCIYNNLVNKQNGIRIRYHKLHDNSSGIVKVLSWVYLLWLNFAFYILQFRFLGKEPGMQIYEQKKLNYYSSESEEYHNKNQSLSVEEFVKVCSLYDVISFDIFDTLIFRPMDVPSDMFYLIGERLGISDYKNIRIYAEYDARIKCKEKYNHTEINLLDIYEHLKDEVGIDYKEGMKVEEDIELSLCFANPFMKKVWDELQKRGKRIVITSDMYLPLSTIEKMLHKNGYDGYEKLYLSNEYSKSKADGTLYKEVINDNPNALIIHIGDNNNSDIKMAQINGIKTLSYPNVNHNNSLYRSEDMSYIIGSAYRGIVSNYIYNGLNTYSMEYEYGFIYGGIFVLGYCHFIHEYCKHNAIDRILFLSRDGDTLMKAYISIYPEEEDNCNYAYWSRKCATKLMASFDKHDYYRRFIFHKVNQGYTIEEILSSMELDELIYEIDNNAIGFKTTDKLTDKNAQLLKGFIESNWTMVENTYNPQHNAAKKYYKDILKDVNKTVAIDIGWAGSGALSLAYLMKHKWDIPVQLTGILAGTNTMYNAEPDATEPFLQSGKLVSYLYSQSHNRDLLKKHDPAKDYNVFWELLLSSPTPQFVGFYEEEPYLRFGDYDDNIEGINEIQRGILDYINEYTDRFGSPIDGTFKYMYNISGRDAYAPMLLAASHNEKYLRAISKKFSLEINVK